MSVNAKEETHIDSLDSDTHDSEVHDSKESDTSSLPGAVAVESKESKEPKEILIVVFIHGFKGTDSTFGGFPERLQHVLSETIPGVIVECVVFPAYETKGELTAAVIRFADWLTTLTVEREVASGEGGGAGRAKIVLCGHSMGGLLAADTLLEFVKTRPDQTAPLWPRIIALIAFDTPYYGLHPFVIKNSATKAAEYASTARNIATGIFGSLAAVGLATKKATNQAKPVAAITAPPPTASSSSNPSGGWAKWAPAAYAVGGALLAGGAAGAAYYKREDLNEGYTWATDHMKYVGNLWNEDALKRRVEDVIGVEERLGVLFRTFYTWLPPAPPTHYAPRTFIVLPPKSSSTSSLLSHFTPARNGIAPDELQAHTGMFGGGTNDGYYVLGLETAGIVREAVIRSRGRGGVEDGDGDGEDGGRDGEKGAGAGEAMSESLGERIDAKEKGGGGGDILVDL